MTDRKPMDVTVSWGKESLVRLMRAVVRFDCQITDTFMNVSYGPRRTHHDDVHLRVQIPPQHLDAFRAEANPREMREPMRVDLGWCEPTWGGVTRKETP